MKIILDRDKSYPLYRQLVDVLMGAINTGEYAPNDPLPSEKEFKYDLGINHLTIRKALSVLEREGYIYKVRGKGTFIAEGRHFLGDKKDESVSKIIGLSMPEVLEDSYMMKTERAVVDFFYEKKIHVLRMSCSDPVDQIRHLEHNLDLLSGVVVHANNSNKHFAKLIDLSKKKSVPLVIAGNLATESEITVDHILSDDVSGAREAVDYFIKGGRSKVIFATLEAYENRLFDRRVGYEKAMKSNNLKCETATIKTEQTSGYSRFDCRELIKRIQNADAPVAIITENDVIAKNIYIALTNVGIAMPDKVELMGFGNDLWDGEYSTHETMQISTVNVPWGEIGAEAARILYSRINGCDAPIKRPSFSTTIIHRKTTRG